MAESSRLGIVMGCHQRVRPPSAGISPSSAAGPIPVYGEGFCSGPPEANPYPYPYGYIPEPEAGIPDPCLSLPKTTYIGPNLMTLYLSQLMSVTGKYLESLGVYEPTERTPFTSPDALSLDGAEGGGDADVVKVALTIGPMPVQLFLDKFLPNEAQIPKSKSRKGICSCIPAKRANDAFVSELCFLSAIFQLILWPGQDDEKHMPRI